MPYIMELRSRVLAEVEPVNMDPGVPGPFISTTEGPGELLVPAGQKRQLLLMS